MDENFSLPLPEHDALAAPGMFEIPKAKDFAGVIAASASSTLIECLRITSDKDIFFKKGDEIVVFELAVQVGQNPVNDIRYTEKIAVHFDKADQLTPWVFALRQTFPKVPHINALHFDEPLSLCVYETKYEELKLEWRSAKFLSDIRKWIELSAMGKLHQDDQPLEPFLVANMGTIIIPPDIAEGDTLYIYSINKTRNRISLFASKQNFPEYQPFQNHLIYLKGQAQANGVMGRTPINIADLNLLLKPVGINLFETLKEKFKLLPKTNAALTKRIIIFLELPKETRKAANENDFYIFLTTETIEEIGLTLGFWERGPLGVADILFPPALSDGAGKNLTVGTLIPQIQLSPELAFLLSGSAEDYARRKASIFQIGAGALGSQFFMNLARMGYGKWTITDDDFLLPHNLVRHALDSSYLANLKSLGLAVVANGLFGVADFIEPLTENYLFPEDKTQLDRHLSAAEVIVDISTSVAVARHLSARTDLSARRISIFLSPSGKDLVILAENKDRSNALDVLEFQYYREIINNGQLADHLIPADGVRFSKSCRDRTSRIPQENVAALAAVASNQFRKIIRETSPFIGIWQLNEDNMEIKAHITQPAPVRVATVGEWTLVIDSQFIDKISQARLSRLPNETGGILIGGYDLERKKIYVMDTLLSPADSQEYPTAYIRGIDGVEGRFLAYEAQTADHLKYIGEWHSHPKNCSLQMSNDDTILFTYIKQEMNAIGFPALMLIAGDDQSFAIYLDA